MSANSKNYNKNNISKIARMRPRMRTATSKKYNQNGGEFLIESLKKNFDVTTAIIIYFLIILLICGGAVGGYFLAKSGGGFSDENNNNNNNNNARGHNEQHENDIRLYFGYIIMGICCFIAFIMLLPFILEGFARLFGLEMHRSIFDPVI